MFVPIGGFCLLLSFLVVDVGLGEDKAEDAEQNNDRGSEHGAGDINTETNVEKIQKQQGSDQV